MKYAAFISALCLLAMSVHTAHAQIRIVSREQLEAVESPRLSADSLSLNFSTRHMVAPPMNEDDPPQYFRYQMTNVGNEPVSIHRINTTCSCVTATVADRVLNPGKSTVLTARYDPKGHPGRFERKIFVYTGPGNEPAAVLKLTVDVGYSDDKSGLYHVQMGGIRLRTGEVVFEKGVKAVQKLNFINLSGSELRLDCERMFLPRNITFETRPEVLKHGEEGVMVIGYEPSPDERHERIPLILKDLGVSPGRSTINIRIE